MGGTVVGPTEWIFYGMRQLMLDVIRAIAKHLIQYGSCHGTKSMPNHGVRIKAQIA